REQRLAVQAEALADLVDRRPLVLDDPRQHGEDPLQAVGGGDPAHDAAPCGATKPRSQSTTSWRTSGGSSTSAWSNSVIRKLRSASWLRTARATTTLPSSRRSATSRSGWSTSTDLATP